jgi:hypothetical protein
MMDMAGAPPPPHVHAQPIRGREKAPPLEGAAAGEGDGAVVRRCHWRWSSPSRAAAGRRAERRQWQTGASSRSTPGDVEGLVGGGAADAQREYLPEKARNSRQHAPSSRLHRRVPVPAEPELAAYIGGTRGL